MNALITIGVIIVIALAVSLANVLGWWVSRAGPWHWKVLLGPWSYTKAVGVARREWPTKEWRRMLAYLRQRLRQEPKPPSLAEMDAAQAVLEVDPGNDYRGETEAVWDADVLEIWPDNSDMFTARLRQNGSPDLLADFSMAECGVLVQPGDLLIVTPKKVILRQLGRWTDEELKEITRRAYEQYESLKPYLEEGGKC